jgi:hypothetical protein
MPWTSAGTVEDVFRRRSRTDPDAPDVSGLSLRKRAPGGSTPVLPSLGLVQQLLDEFGLKHSIDDDGDLAVRWEKCTIFFFFRGEHGEMLRARAYLNRWFDVDMRTGMTVVLDEWNRTRAMPKAFTILPDEGLVGICGEQVYDFAPGATREQIKFTVGVWIETLLHFVEWVDEQL